MKYMDNSMRIIRSCSTHSMGVWRPAHGPDGRGEVHVRSFGTLLVGGDGRVWAPAESDCILK
jgi:hypothetical protein